MLLIKKTNLLWYNISQYIHLSYTWNISAVFVELNNPYLHDRMLDNYNSVDLLSLYDQYPQLILFLIVELWLGIVHVNIVIPNISLCSFSTSTNSFSSDIIIPDSFTHDLFINNVHESHTQHLFRFVFAYLNVTFKLFWKFLLSGEFCLMRQKPFKCVCATSSVWVWLSTQMCYNSNANKPHLLCYIAYE